MSFQTPLSCLACLALLLAAPAGWPQPSHTISLAERIKQGSTEAMLEAGNISATEVMPLLRNHLKDSDTSDYSGRPGNWQPRQAAQLALAKLGDEIEQKKIGCELLYGNLAEQSTAFYKLEYVGGWFEIDRLTRFLADTEENVNQMMPQAGIADGDAAIGTRQYLAVTALDRMHLHDPVASSGNEHPYLAASRRAKEWQQYIDVHRHELEKLTPTGEGAVASDDYCGNYLASLPQRPDSYRVLLDDGAIRLVAVEQPGFGTRPGSASFNGTDVPIREWSDSRVTVELPPNTNGKLILVRADSKRFSVMIH